MTVNYHKVALALRNAHQDAMYAYSIGVFGAYCDADGQIKSAIWVEPAKARVLDEIKDAAALLGFELVEKETPATEPQAIIPETTLSDIRDTARKVHNTDVTWSPDGGHHVTAPDDNLSTAGGFSQQEPSAIQEQAS